MKASHMSQDLDRTDVDPFGHLTRSEYEEKIQSLRAEADAQKLHALQLANEMYAKIEAGLI